MSCVERCRPYPIVFFALPLNLWSERVIRTHRRSCRGPICALIIYSGFRCMKLQGDSKFFAYLRGNLDPKCVFISIGPPKPVWDIPCYFQAELRHTVELLLMRGTTEV